MDMKKIVIESGDLSLRELNDKADVLNITHIIRNCAIRSTIVLLIRYMDDPECKKMMPKIGKKEKRIGKLLKQFIEFEKELTPDDKDDKEKLKEFVKKKHAVIENCPDDILFAAYGPIQVPFEKEAGIFVDEAIKTQNANDRKFFRLGIYLGKNLIGCLTFEYNLIETEGYNAKTTLDPGIFIDPKYRTREGTDIKRWQEVFSLMVAFMESFYPDQNKSIPISITTHHLNYETKNIFTKWFVEYKKPVCLEGIGKRRFFTIGYKEFKTAFMLNNPKVTVSFTSQGREQRHFINPKGPLIGETEKTEEVPRSKII
jgi:hypothetical protein